MNYNVERAQQIPNLFTASELEAMPTLHQGQYENLKIESHDSFELNGREIDGVRVWLSRMTVADGEPANDMISVEHLIDGKWTVHVRYAGRRLE